MANASKKKMRAGANEKGTGTGAMTDIDKDKIKENTVLSSRDKSRHSAKRGLDSKVVQTEQLKATRHRCHGLKTTMAAPAIVVAFT